MSHARALPKFDLGDFYFTESDDPLVPGNAFAEFRREADWVFRLFEPELQTGAAERAVVSVGKDPVPVINLASYNYLGLAQHCEVVGAAIEALKTFGTGACGSPVLSGMMAPHRSLEAMLSKFSGREGAILFNSGNAGAIGLLAAVLRKGDVAILDQHSHICLIEGVKLSGARVEFFAHNDPHDLEAKLEKHAGKRRLVIVEGLYSMHGDFGALDTLVPVAKHHGVDVMVDEAHSILAIGDNGRGAAERFGVEKDVKLSYGTFSKAFANAGAAVMGPHETLDYVRYFANTYAFSVALPPAVVAGVAAALDVATRNPSLRERLAANADRLRKGLHTLGLDTGESEAHIVPIIIGDRRDLLYELTGTLRARGVFVAPVDYPSVPADQLRLRTCVSAAHTDRDIDEALDIFARTIPRRGA